MRWISTLVLLLVLAVAVDAQTKPKSDTAQPKPEVVDSTSAIQKLDRESLARRILDLRQYLADLNTETMRVQMEIGLLEQLYTAKGDTVRFQRLPQRK